jgi:hypothetical protein
MRRMDFIEQHWESLLDQLVKTGRFRLADYPYNTDEEAKVLTVLGDMEASGFLEGTTGGELVWRAGPKVTKLMNLSEEGLKPLR